MAGSVNKVMLVGNVGKEPDMRRLNSGELIANFSLATTESWRDKASGERKDRTEWHNIVVFNENIAKIVEQYVKKGSRLFVEGQLQTRKWQDKDGQTRYTTEVVLQRFRGELVLLDARGAGAGSGVGALGDDRDGDGHGGMDDGGYGGRGALGARGSSAGGGGYGGGQARGASERQSGGGAGGGGGFASADGILDDDIPF